MADVLTHLNLLLGGQSTKAVPKSVRIGQRGINVIERIVEDSGQ